MHKQNKLLYKDFYLNRTMKDFFKTLTNNPELAYFDSAASTQTFQGVVNRITQYYENERCNVHRGDFPQSIKVTQECQEARESVAKLINADTDQIMFTSGATDGLNMVAKWCENAKVVIISEAEHSANILPWLAQGRTIDNGRLVVLPLSSKGVVDPSVANEIFKKCSDAVLSLISTSNVNGLTNDLKTIIGMAHSHGIPVCIDACQTLSSHKIDVKELDPDWMVASGHKMFGPTGIGFLYSKTDYTDFKPIRYGGGTVNGYNFHGSVDFYDGPIKHEPGTPNIAGILGLGVAAEWINYIGYDEIKSQLSRVQNTLTEQGLFNIGGMHLIHPSDTIRNVFSFTTDVHPADISAFLGLQNVAVRVGKVCAHPMVNKYGKGSILRVSTHIYNDEQDCKKLVETLCQTIQKLN